MAISILFILDAKGKVLLSRNYRGDITGTVATKFFNKLQSSEESDIKPVYTEDGVTYAFVKMNSLIFLATTKKNANVVMILFFLYKLVSVFESYFGEIDEEAIRDNFVIIYELLDEVMDFGYPQITDGRILTEYIFQEGHKHVEVVKPPQAVTSAVSWRPEGIVHGKNEVFLDVIEKLHLLVSSSGTVLHSEIIGKVAMRSLLTGMPELKLGLNDKIMLEAAGKSKLAKAKGRSVDLEDVKFHQCVRLSRFESDRTISFIPPDGEFELMSYRLTTPVKPLFWVETSIEKHSQSRIEFVVKAKAQYRARSVASAVDICVPVPADVDSPVFKASMGSVAYRPEKNALIWTIKHFGGGKEHILRAQFGLPSVTGEDANSWKRPISVEFDIPYFTVSGIQVRYLKIVEKSGYQALPWVRYITQNGDYLLRCK